MLERFNRGYKFIDRSRGRKNMCMILAGYKSAIWDDVFARLEYAIPGNIDVCIMSSGLYSEYLDNICENNDWSYLYTRKNQISAIQNLAIRLHPSAEWIYKIDEDIFITKGFFEKLMETWIYIEKNTDSCPSIVAPIINVNGYTYIKLLDKLNLREGFLKKFGDIKMSSGIEHHEWIRTDDEFARYMWGDDEEDLSDIDSLTERFISEHLSYSHCPIRFSIGAILFSREFWKGMKGFPVKTGSGLGDDEEEICYQAINYARPIVVNENVVVGHLGFGPQTDSMMQYYRAHRDRFGLKQSDHPRQSIGITVSCHKECNTPYSTVYIPVEAGASTRNMHLTDFLRDDDGENISDLNYTFSELSVQYWAWKNLDLEIYGACHYRRYFYLGDNKYTTNDHGQIEEGKLSEITYHKFRIDDEELIRLTMEKYDIVVPLSWDVRKAPTPKGYQNNVKDHMLAYELFTESDIRCLTGITKEYVPEWSGYLDKYLTGYEYIGYNCFIMKKKNFAELCEKEFKILLKFAQKNRHIGIEDRLCGYLGEVLFSAFIMSCKDGGLKVLHAPLVFFGNTAMEKGIKPQDRETGKLIGLLPPSRNFMNRRFNEVISKMADKNESGSY